MTKRIISYCDSCDAQGRESIGSPVRIKIDAQQTRELDLCPTCDVELLGHLRSLLDDLGQPVTDQTPIVDKSGAKLSACPSCGKTYKHAASLSSHMTKKHGARFPEPEKPHECPSCDLSFSTPQGLGAHRSRVHGYKKGDGNPAPAPAKKAASRRSRAARATSEQEQLAV